VPEFRHGFPDPRSGVQRVANAVQGTNKGPMEALRGLSEQLVAIGEGNPQASSTLLGQAAESAMQALIASKESEGAAAAFRTTRFAGRVLSTE
jgi:hypothetical protein